MSYFARLARQSQLDVAGNAAPAAGAADAGARTGEAADIAEIDAVRVAPTPITTDSQKPARAARLEPAMGVSPPADAAASRAAAAPGATQSRGTAPVEAPTHDATAAEPAAPTPDPAPTIRSAPSGPGETTMPTLQQVIEWIAEGPQPPAAPAAPLAHRREPDPAPLEIRETPAAGESARMPAASPAVAEAGGELRARLPAARSAGSRAAPPVATERGAKREPSVAERRVAHELPLEEIVEVSIGSINVRVEGPQPAAPSPVAAPAVQRATPSPARPASGSRLRRHYVRR